MGVTEYRIVFSFSERYGFGLEADISDISAIVICEAYGSAYLNTFFQYVLLMQQEVIYMI